MTTCTRAEMEAAFRAGGIDPDRHGSLADPGIALAAVARDVLDRAFGTAAPEPGTRYTIEIRTDVPHDDVWPRLRSELESRVGLTVAQTATGAETAAEVTVTSPTAPDGPDGTPFHAAWEYTTD